jgi:hypothetical protein
MTNTLFTFGCSYTANYNIMTNQKYKDFKGGMLPDVWPKVLSKKLNIDLRNYGEPGIGNEQIFHNFCKHINEINENDTLIIGWTFLQRHRWVNLNKSQWVTVGVGSKDDNIITKNTNDEIIINRTNSLYIQNVYDYEKIIDLYCECKKIDVYYWSGDKEIIYRQPKELLNNSKYLSNNFIREDEIPFDEVFRRGGELIVTETKGLIQDHHMGESGHRIMAELFYEHIKN